MRTWLAVATVVVLVSPARSGAEPQWLAAFNERYSSATNLDACGVCHENFTSNSPRNPYGVAFKEAGGTSNPTAAFAAIEGDDSDGDGTLNLEEILTGSGFFPGWSCETYLQAIDAPANLADLVDPTNVGCDTSPTTTSTTSTSVPVAVCAQPVTTGAAPTASDCLFILRTAVGTEICSPACICAPKGTLPTTATDALLCLRRAVGQPAELACPC